MAPAEYGPLLAQADVAIGTLGLYLKDMNEASPIKTREYLASGLPVIIGYRDTDFPDGAPFLLQVPNRADGVAQSQAAIARFVDAWRGRRVTRASVQELDSAGKETERLAFLAEFARETVPSRGCVRARAAIDPVSLPISVVLVTWNSEPVLRASMGALVASIPRPAQLVVVDNASTDRSVEIVAAGARELPGDRADRRA